MSCSYADGLSPYENKGVLGVPEKFDSEEKVNDKCAILASWIETSKHVVVHTGAGISTSAGIPDFRGPNGVWTLEKAGKKPNINISFDDAVPTKTHMALKHLIDNEYVQYIISQNIDGLHLKTGVPRIHIAELHGNMFVAQCNTCHVQFVRSTATTSVGKKCLEEKCKRAVVRGRACRGKLYDTILDWEHNLPEVDLEMSDYHSSIADLNICLGTTLQIVPSGNLPLKCKKYGGKLVIVNLQPTKHDNKADLIINSFVDNVMSKVMKLLGLEIPEYMSDIDPTKYQATGGMIDWNISHWDVKKMKTRYENVVREYRKRRSEERTVKTEKRVKQEDEDTKDIKKVCRKEEITDEIVVTVVDLTEGDLTDDDIFVE